MPGSGLYEAIKAPGSGAPDVVVRIQRVERLNVDGDVANTPAIIFSCEHIASAVLVLWIFSLGGLTPPRFFTIIIASLFSSCLA